MKKSWILMAFAMLTGLCVLAEGVAKAEIDKAAPEFELASITGDKVSLSGFKGKIVVLEWINLECPFVKKFYSPGKMQKLQKDYTEKGIVWLSICSSAPGKQGHMAADKWVEAVKEKHIHSTAVLLDPEGQVGKTYGAKTTPHIFIVGKDGNLVYMGAIDSIPSTKPDDIEKAKNYLSSALDALLEGKEVDEKTTKAYGCSVKYAE